MAEDDVVLTEAKSLGWVPKEDFKGDLDHWVDAEVFVERGRQILPIARANNKALISKVAILESDMNSLRSSLQAANATISALEESHEQDVREQVQAVRKELKEELAKASREGDHEAVAELTDKLSELHIASADLDEKPKSKKKEPQELKLDPVISEWISRNSDFSKNPRKVALGQAIATELRNEGNTSVGAEFLDAVAERVEKLLGKEAEGPGKVSGGGGGSGRREIGNGKSYADLPREAKDACEKMASRLVGPNRAHKDVESWRKSYVKQYFAGEQ